MNIRYRTLSCLIFLLGNACENAAPTSFERIERYENGQISRQSTIVNGKKEGKMTDYYNDGKRMAERFFENGEQQGRTLIFYPNGSLKEVQYFDKGKKQSGDTIWYDNGKIEFVTQLKDDKKNGYLRKWGPSGELIYEAKYNMDTLVEVKGQPIDRTNTATKPSQILKKQG